MKRVHNRQPVEQRQVHFRGLLIRGGIRKQGQVDRGMDHVNSDETKRCSAHEASTPLRHHRYQRLPSPGKEFSPRGGGKCAAGTGEPHHVTAEASLTMMCGGKIQTPSFPSMSGATP